MKKIILLFLFSFILLAPVRLDAKEENKVKTENLEDNNTTKSNENDVEKPEYLLGRTSEGLQALKDGEIVVDKLVSIKGKDYYFDKEGVSQTGWIFYENNWYYIEENQKLIENGIRVINDSFFLFRDKIAVKEEFVKVDSGYKYFDKYCYMLRNTWYFIDGKWYYFDKNGNRIENGINKIGNNWYGFKNGHAIENDWIQNSKGDWYYFGKDCYLEIEKFIKNSDGTKSYVAKNGVRVENGWEKIKDIWYLFKDGKSLTNTLNLHTNGKNYYLDENGKMLESSWAYVDGKWMYFDNYGERVEIGWRAINSDWFYFKNGVALSDTWVGEKNGEKYYLDSSCYMVHDKWMQDEKGFWIYFNHYGAKVENGWSHDGKYWSYFEDGVAVSNRLINYKSSKYYIGKYCYMKSNEWGYMDNGDWMYFYEDGKLATDVFIGGYYVGLDGVYFDLSNRKILNVPTLSQLYPYSLPMGCEGTSFTMAIKYKGVTGYSQYDINSLFTITGNPRTGFIGSPFSGLLVYGTTPTIWPEALIKYTSGIYSNVKDLTGCDLSTMLREIDKGNPVVYWFTYGSGNMIDVYTPNGIIRNSTSMHCVTLVGYDANTLYCNDPITNTTVRFSLRSMYNNFVRYGRKAVAVR